MRAAAERLWNTEGHDAETCTCEAQTEWTSAGFLKELLLNHLQNPGTGESDFYVQIFYSIVTAEVTKELQLNKSEINSIDFKQRPNNK